MGVFTYRALDPRQRTQSGTVAADTPASARQALRARGLAIASVEPVRPQTARRWRLPWSKGNQEQVAELWRNLAVLLQAGVPLADALSVCLRQQRGPIQTALRQLHESVTSGQPFAEALALHPHWFDALTRAIVQVGERSGFLAGALAELADYQARRRAVANRLGTALIYPVILCLVGTAVVIFLMSHVVPQLVEVLAAAGRELPAPTRLLKALSDALMRYGPVLLLAFCALALSTAACRRTRRGKRLLERCLMSLPVLGDLLRKAWVARISLMLSTMLRADVRFTEALRTVRHGLPHRLYADELERLESAIEAGADIGQPLRDSRLIPPLVVHLLAIGQESGELPRMLEQLRASYEKEVNLALSRFLAVLEPALILVLAVVIGFVVFATLLPILETTRMVQ
jgi:type II secretory pathway component PulF